MHQQPIPPPRSGAASPEATAIATDTRSRPPHTSILVVKAAGLGDLMLALPALRALRQSFPHARIDVLVTPQAAGLLRDSPLVDRVLTVDKTPFDSASGVVRAPWRVFALAVLAWRLHAARYDAVLLMHHLTLPFGRLKYRLLLLATHPARSYGLDNGHGSFLDVRIPDAGFGARHEAEYCLDVAQALDAPHAPLRIPTLATTIAGPCLADLGWEECIQEQPAIADGPLVALHVGSGTYSVARRWPLERFVALAQALHRATGARILLIGGDDERVLLAEAYQSLGGAPWVLPPATNWSLRQIAARLARCDLFIGNDAFPMHLAAAVGVPVVAIFGPSNAQAWRPLPCAPGGAVPVVRRNLACSPCFYRGHALGTPQGCPPRICLNELPVAAVLSMALRMLGRDPSCAMERPKPL